MNTTATIEFSHEGKTYRISQEKAARARVLVLPTGALIGLELTETLPAKLVAVRELAPAEADLLPWEPVAEDEIVG